MGLPFESPNDQESLELTESNISIETSFNPRFCTYGAIPEDNSPSKLSIRHRLFPTGFVRETRLIFSFAWPTILTNLCINIVAPTAMMFCGHLGTEELDGVALANSLVNVCGISLACGMTTACDTLFPQAYGSRNKYMVGVYLQRSLLINLLLCFFSWTFYLNTEKLLLWLGQDPCVASIAGEYALYFMPGLLFFIIYQVFIKFLQSQNRVLPPVVFGILGNGFNVLGQYLAIYVFNYGIRGSALVQALTFGVMSLLSILYVIASGIYTHTWTGWSWKTLEGWGEYLRIGIAGLVMMGVEWWAYEAGLLMSGLLGEIALGATTVGFQLQSINYVIPSGFSVASSVRVGQSLGAGNPDGAKTAAYVAQIMAWIVFIGAAVVLLAVKDVIPLLFTTDVAVVKKASEQIPVIVLIMFLNAITCTSAGTLRGAGRQVTGAICNCLGYIIISLPVSFTLMFVLEIGAVGFWLGLAVGIAPICVAFIILVVRTDWNREVQKAHVRVNGSSTVHGQDDTAAILSDTDRMYTNSNGTRLCHATPRLLEPLQTQYQKFKLIIKCVAIFLFMFCVFLVGIMVRIYVPVPLNNFVNETTDINTSAVELNKTEHLTF